MNYSKKTFIDSAQISVTAGNGGDGRVSFRREKYIPKGGPDGGDGGDGGDVYFRVNHNMSTLLDFRAKPKYSAESGEMGKKKKMSGAKGQDLYIDVPLGTLIYEMVDGKDVLVSDLVDKDETFLIASGGKGGKGNTRFKSSVNQAPTKATRGTKGESKDILLEVKLVADVGFVGLPNAGKSTLVNFLTNANAKVANYPFTTLSPNLGSLQRPGREEIIFADIPGLIEGASEGKGLGANFLRHIERTRIILHIIDPLPHDAIEVGTLAQDDIVKETISKYDAIQAELAKHKIDLTSKPQIVAINKCDIHEILQSFDAISSKLKTTRGVEPHAISAVTGYGVDDLISKVYDTLQSAPKITVFDADIEVTKVYTIDTLPNRRVVRG